MKRLVLCLDGTWNRADQPSPTNVVMTVVRTAKRDGQTVQIGYYDQGVGTGNVLDRFTGGAFGEGLEDNINDAYRFLIGNYELGDELYLFGFSRGAYTARSLAGMIRKCGILKRASAREYAAAVALYRNAEHPDDPGPTAFRQQHSMAGSGRIEIRFIGVWDTVGALGIPLRGLRWLTRREYQFHDTELSGSVKFAYHALAVDEHRAPFAPTLWTYKPKDGQTVEQTWFCGAHSDVGGGYAQRGLSDITLTWMLGKARATGLVLDSDAMAAYALNPDARGTLHNSKTGLYWLTRGLDRQIGVATPGRDADAAPILDPTQAVHESVRQRWDADPTYRPKSLASYFKLVRDPRALG